MNVTTTNLTDEDLQLLSSEVFPRVFGENTSLVRHLEDQLATTRSLEVTVNAVHSDHQGSSSDRTNLDSIRWLYTLSNCSVPIVAFCFSQPPLAGASFQPAVARRELAERIVTIPSDSQKLPSNGEGAWMRLREQLFTEEATSVLRGLICAGVIPAPDECKDLITSVLHQAIQYGDFDIAKESVRDLLAVDKGGGDDVGSTATIFTAAGVPPEKRQAVATYLFNLQRLQALVNEPSDVGALVRCGYASAEEIANVGEPAVQSIMREGVPCERAERIRSHALRIASRSEHLWTQALAVRGTGGSSMDVSLAAVAATPSSGPQDEREEINLSTMFGVDSMGCEECASITGPAAFFVDLLNKLGHTPTTAGRNAQGVTLLDKLFERRADLGDLQLSCANTKVLVPYVDLVNEVLESVVWNLQDQKEPRIKPVDADENDTSESSLMQPRNTNFQVYSKILQPLVSPLHSFPYNQAIHSGRAYLTALGASGCRLLSTFRSPYAIASDDKNINAVGEALDHALAAEILNLQREDYVAITKQGFYSLELLKTLVDGNMNQTEYGKIIGLRPRCQYWGFQNDDDMAPQNLTWDKGLAKIKDELLPRSGLTLEDLINVLKTKYCNGKLFIEIKNKTKEQDPDPTELLESMRLREWVSDPTKPPLLRVVTCDRLQAFLRLRNKSQWPIEELDAVVATFAEQGMSQDGMTITPTMLDNLAAVRQLADLTNLSPTKLQPFWGDMNTHGPNSLYAQLFLSAVLPEETRKVLTPDGSGRISPGQPTPISDDSLLLMLMALDLTLAEYESIRIALGLQSPVPLTLANISAVYRVSVLCKILKISPQAYSQFLELYPADWKPFMDPRTTLGLVRDYPPLQPTTTRWTLDRLLFVIRRIPSATDERCKPTMERHLQITESIRSCLHSKELQDVKRKMEDESALLILVDELISNASGRKDVMQFIQSPGDISIDSCVAKHFISELSNIVGKSSATQLCAKIICAAAGQDRRDTFLNAFLPSRYQEKQRQAVLKSLTLIFPDLSLPLLTFCLSNLIRDVTGQIPGMDIFLRLAETPETTASKFSGYFRPPTTGVYVFRSKSQPKRAVLDETLLNFQKQDPFWTANTSQLIGSRWYKLDFDGDMRDLTWVAKQAEGAQPASFNRSELLDARLVNDTAQVIVDLMRVSILVDRFRLYGAEVEFTPVIQYLLSKAGPESLDFKKFSLQSVYNLEQYLELREEFTKKGAKLPLLTFYKWVLSPETFDKSGEDKTYSELTDKLSKVTGWPTPLCTEFLQSKYPKHDAKKLVELFQAIPTLYQMREAIRFVQDLNLPSLSTRSLFAIAQPALKDLVQADFANAAALRLAIQSRRFPGLSTTGGTALSEASDSIRSSQRNALVYYLLSTQYARDKDLNDADLLFGHFLIDVQMGTGLQTSRIKQAISSVQVFIQRCALGAEPGIRSELFNRTELEYMLRYRLWEADRKAYLYPENWADPTLRDNKTEQFQVLESKVMQTKMDSESVADIVKDYVHSVDEIAYLRVDSYLLNRIRYGGANPLDHDDIHIIGRSRTSPPQFYYRKVSMPMLKTMGPIWTPWSKIRVEIPVQDTDAGIKKLPRPGSYILPVVFNDQLYIFLPDVTLGRKDPERTDQTYENLIRQGKPSDIRPAGVWEIRMGYIRLNNGKWSPRTVSPSAIHVNPDQEKNMPDISNFKFWIMPERQNLSLTIVVEGITSDKQPSSLGKFQIRDQQLVLIEEDGLPVPRVYSDNTKNIPLSADGETITTKFLRFQSEYQENPSIPEKDIIFDKGKKATLRLGGTEIRDLLKKSTCDWIMEFNHPGPDTSGKYEARGLVLEVSNSNSISQYINLSMLHGFRVERLFNRTSSLLVKTARQQDRIELTFDTLKSIVHTAPDFLHSDAFGRWTENTREKKVHYHECAAPFAIYNWELGVHVPSLIMERLMATQQYELALKVARLVFDPRIDGTDVYRCWSFPPFREKDVIKTKLDSLQEWHESGGNVHAAARGHPVAYMKRIAMKYIELLIAMGDEYFRRDTLESIPLAIQMYTEASHVFGPQPVEFPQLGKRKAKTYNEIKNDLNELSNATVDMELSFPFDIKPGQRGTTVAQGSMPRSFLRTGYFCVPGNPYLVSLRAAIDDRLYKIRNGMDINGRKRTLPLFEPPIDPGALQRAKGPGGKGIAGLLSDLESPMPRYRFQRLIQNALELVNELKASGQQLLSIKEKRDSEGLSMLRSKHQSAILALVTRVKECQKVEANRSIEALEEARKQQEMRLEYFLALTGDTKEIPPPGGTWRDIPQSIEKPQMDDFRMSPFEQEEMKKADEASNLNLGAGAFETAAAAAFAIPMFGMKAQPMGTGVDTSVGGQNIGQGLLTYGSALKVAAQRVQDDGAKAARKAVATRQLQERRLEANICGRELVRIDKELNGLRSRVDTCEAEIRVQKQEIDNAAAEEEWLRTKYTSQELYALLDHSMGTLFHQTYLMATAMVKTAARALDFELAIRPQNSTLQDSVASSGGYWENSRDGQLSGEALLLDLKRMESIYMESRTHDFEILKIVSLRQVNPLALLQLQESCKADFDIPEVLFDMDFPGHYCRRISSVAVSMPCIVGPYTNLSCTLSLQQHKYRISSTAASYSKQKEASFRTDRIPISSIAVSSGIQDTGVSDLQFRDNGRYGPFEGAGAISTWRIALPETLKQFDYRSITDVVLHLRYSAFSSGGLLEESASSAVRKWAKQTTSTAYGKLDKVVAVDLQNDYPSEWQRIASTGSIQLQHLDQRLPFWARRETSPIKSAAITLYIAPEPEEHTEISISIDQNKVTLKKGVFCIRIVPTEEC
ncbi:hypothetical protein EYZ11_007316 [Aspergillus tanneri]|uniref:Uncharacterized protein n=1 Tax=Aspergillus tanneri TaxID=1220188 RepID=A0A4S3JIY2_9EURO|nr:hypothetical protein EYZ11_007316 [Aspergillus tanneri]